LIREYLVEVTAHEVGHTLRSAHNFRASNMLKPEELLDDAKTDVMSQFRFGDGLQPNRDRPKGKKQGTSARRRLGRTIIGAIEYAYKTIDGEEDVELAKIASRCAEPELGYATDEDALGTLSPASMDPLVNQFDQSSDPIGFYTDRIKIVRELWTSMEEACSKKAKAIRFCAAR